MSKAIKIRKGIDIKLLGAPEVKISEAPASKVYAIKPADFPGLVPKLTVKEGEEVQAGSPLFFDKKREEIIFTSPVSGEVVEIKRGDKRRILEVKILADSELRFKSFAPWNAQSGDRKTLIAQMLEMGLWPLIKQRPYGIVASPGDEPRDIFVSTFDSAPLAPDMAFVLKDEKQHFKTGIEALRKLTSGKVHLGVKKGDTFFADITGVERHEVSGPHPAGNVGVLIHHTFPINKGETIWTVGPADVAMIGRCLSTGKYDASRIVALTGSEVKNTGYYASRIGAAIHVMTSNNVKEGSIRYISGNVLTGSKVTEDGFLGFYDTQITVIPEGDEKKFFLTEGWLAPGFDKFSLNKSFPSWLTPGKKYRIDTNLNGEERAFVVTGEMEQVFPFDIYPMQLIKSIMVNDIDAMEKLGIYEVDAEDFALCEFVCTSKINIQDVVRKGLEDMRKEFAS
jgi:Na+-transporting NADH:ubiquinone oxidoreductase subunit A